MAGRFWETACQPNPGRFRPHSLPWVTRICMHNKKNWGCPADLLTNQTVSDRSPRPYLKGAADRDRTHDTTRRGLLLYQLGQQSQQNKVDTIFSNRNLV